MIQHSEEAGNKQRDAGAADNPTPYVSEIFKLNGGTKATNFAISQVLVYP